MSVPRVILILMRLSATIQVIVGVGFWTGHWYSLLPIHWANGILFVLLLWTIAVIALVQRRAAGRALFAILWGLVVVALGFAQQGILPGGLHWVIRVLHLAIGLAALGIAEGLAARQPKTVAVA
jgi:hypothetical protein